MKKITVAIMILVSAVLAGCTENAETVVSDQKITITKLGSDGQTRYRKVTVEGHDYIVTTISGHGVSTVHSESCPCKAK